MTDITKKKIHRQYYPVEFTTKERNILLAVLGEHLGNIGEYHKYQVHAMRLAYSKLENATPRPNTFL